jgi:signal transduction histidine kinase
MAMIECVYQEVQDLMIVTTKVQKQLSMCQYMTGFMQNLMMDLLDLAQIDQNQFKLNKYYFSLYDVLARARAIVGHYAEEKEVTIQMPSVLKKHFLNVFGDGNRFQQVIVNILSNSLKFSNRNSAIKLHLRLINEQLIFKDHPLCHQYLSSVE